MVVTSHRRPLPPLGPRSDGALLFARFQGMAMEFPNFEDAIIVGEIAGRIEGERPGGAIRIIAAHCPWLADWLRTHNGQRGIPLPEVTYLAQLDGDKIILEEFPPIRDDT